MSNSTKPHLENKSHYRNITNSRTLRLLIPLLLMSLIWLQEIVDQLFFGGNWNFAMGRGRPWFHLLASSFSHEDYGHLISNTIIFIPLSWLVLANGLRDFLSVWFCVLSVKILFLVFWTNPAHGLSDICFGLLGYLVIIGFLERRFLTISISFFAIVIFGHYLPSLIPFFSPPGISWIGHFSGFIGGVLGALFIYREPE